MQARARAAKEKKIQVECLLAQHTVTVEVVVVVTLPNQETRTTPQITAVKMPMPQKHLWQRVLWMR